MNSLPHFLNWPTALGAAAIAIPALLILYFLKLKRREYAVASTLLWKKAIQDLQVNSPFQKLRRNLLLLLQMLVLLSLLLAFSRPVTSYRPPPGAKSVILIDRSASMSATDMDGKSRLEEAKKRARDLVDSMGKDSAAMVVAFDDTAETIQSYTSEQAALKRAIDSIEPTDRKTRLKLAYELADASSAFNPDQASTQGNGADVYLYSDGRAPDTADLSLHGKLHFERIGADDSQNIAIVALSARRNYERPTHVQIFARLANFGPEPVDAPVQLSVDGEVVETGSSRRESVMLLPDRWSREQRDQWTTTSGRQAGDSVTFDLEITSAATIKVEQMHKDHDVLAADDVAQVIVPPPRQLSVTLVTEGNAFLENAITNMGLKAPQVMAPAAYEATKPAGSDVVIFDRCTPTFLPPAGNFVYIDAVPPHDDGPAPKISAELDPTGSYAHVEDEYVLDWMRDHPILKDLAMGQLYIAAAMKLKPAADAQVLVDGLKGPLIVMSRDGKRTNLVIGFDVIFSNWPLKPSFPMFWRRSMEFLALGSDMNLRESFEPGMSVVIPRANLQRAGDGLKQLALIGPDGTKKYPIPASGDFALPPFSRVGIYKTDPPVPQYEKLAVNLLDADESNILPVADAPGGVAGAEVQNVKDQLTRREWWWYLVAFVGLPLLFIEWWVYTRRMHL
jgi:hypothetical protein